MHLRLFEALQAVSQVLLGLLEHTLNVYPEVAWLLKQNYFMYVSDVEDAFMLIPIAPWLWPFFLFRFFADDSAQSESLFLHVFGDFGTRGYAASSDAERDGEGHSRAARSRWHCCRPSIKVITHADHSPRLSALVPSLEK